MIVTLLILLVVVGVMQRRRDRIQHERVAEDLCRSLARSADLQDRIDALVEQLTRS